MANGLWISSTTCCLVAIIALLVTARPRIPHPDDFYFRAFTISRKPCRDANDQEGICMFTWDCISKSGKLLSTCLDGFLLGTCCQLQSSSTTSSSNNVTTASPTSTSSPSNRPMVFPTSGRPLVTNSNGNSTSAVTNHVSKSPMWTSQSVSNSVSVPVTFTNTNKPTLGLSALATIPSFLTNGITLTTEEIKKEVDTLLKLPAEDPLPSLTKFPAPVTKMPTTLFHSLGSFGHSRPSSIHSKIEGTVASNMISDSPSTTKTKLPSITIKPLSTKKPILKPTVQLTTKPITKPRPIKPTSNITTPTNLAQALTSSSVLSIIHQLTGTKPLNLSTPSMASPTSSPTKISSKRPLSKLPSKYTTQGGVGSIIKFTSANPTRKTPSPSSPTANSLSQKPSTSSKPIIATTPPPLPKPLAQTSTVSTVSTTTTGSRPSPSFPVTSTPITVTGAPTILQTLLSTLMRPPVILSTTVTQATPTMPSSLWTPTPSKLKYTLRPNPTTKPTKAPTTTSTTTTTTTTTVAPTTSSPLGDLKVTTASSITNHTKFPLSTHRPPTIVFDWTDPLEVPNSTYSPHPTTGSIIISNNHLIVSDSTKPVNTFATLATKSPTIHPPPTTVEIVDENGVVTSQVDHNTLENTKPSPSFPTFPTQGVPPPLVTLFTSIFPTEKPTMATEESHTTFITTAGQSVMDEPTHTTQETKFPEMPTTSINSQLLTTVTTPLSSSTKPTTASTTQRPQWDYRKDCGVRPLRPQGRIVGGRNSQFGAWPWQALVKEATWLGLFVKNKCGGVLINSKWVITAAHCQPSFLATLLVVLGEHDLTGDYETLKPVTKNVRRMVVHRNYNSHTFENDIALLELETTVQFQPHVVPICLPVGNENFVGKMATVTGWGKLSHGGPVPSVLQEVHVPIVTNNKCQQMFLSAGHVKVIRETFICAGYENGGLDSCEGDSGGPLMVQKDDGRWVLAGTVSHGIRCADPNLPGVYMRTSAYKPWMETIMARGR